MTQRFPAPKEDGGWKIQMPERMDGMVRTIVMQGKLWCVMATIDLDGYVRAVFCTPADGRDGAKPDSAMAVLVHHGCMLASWCLQAGAPIENLAERLGNPTASPDGSGVPDTGFMQLILAVAVVMQAELRPVPLENAIYLDAMAALAAAEAS